MKDTYTQYSKVEEDDEMKEDKIQLLRGMQDLMPDEMAVRNYIYAKMRKVLESYGYGEIDTPALESQKLLLAKGNLDADQVKELYLFNDNGGRPIGLRFDLTAPICRILANSPNISKPFKVYYITRMWRYENPQKGRTREFWQLGVESIGSNEPIADAEVISLGVKLLEEIGFKKSFFKMFISDRQILQLFVESLGVKEEKVSDIIRVIDKKDKITKQEFANELKAVGIAEKNIDKVIDFVSLRGEPFEMIKKARSQLKSIDGIEKYLDRLEKIMEYAKAFGTIDQCIIDLGLARGFSYYTNVVFEVFEIDEKGNKLERSRLGGGRYNKLIKQYGGPDIPGTGWGIGIESTLTAMKNKGIYPKVNESSESLVIGVNENLILKAIQVAEEIRLAGVSCEIDVMMRDMRKEFEYANKKKIPFAVIIGEKEVKENKVTLRNMKTGEQKLLTVEDAAREIKEKQLIEAK